MSFTSIIECQPCSISSARVLHVNKIVLLLNLWGNKNYYVSYFFWVGGAVASWLARSTLEQALRVRALAGDNREVKFDVYGKPQTANFCRPSSALCTVESRYLYLQWIVRDTFLFNIMKRIEKQR